MRECIKLSDNISLEDLNPLNAKLGNDYFSNLYHTGAAIVILSNIINDTSISIIRGFTPLARYQDDNITIGWREKKFSQGLGLQLKWKEFELHTALNFARTYVENIKYKCTIEIDRDKGTVSLFRKTLKGKITEITNGLIRTIRSY